MSSEEEGGLFVATGKGRGGPAAAASGGGSSSQSACKTQRSAGASDPQSTGRRATGGHTSARSESDRSPPGTSSGSRPARSPPHPHPGPGPHPPLSLSALSDQERMRKREAKFSAGAGAGRGGGASSLSPPLSAAVPPPLGLPPPPGSPPPVQASAWADAPRAADDRDKKRVKVRIGQRDDLKP